MIKRKGFSFYLPTDLKEKIPWNNRSEWLEIATAYVLDQYYHIPGVKEDFECIREARRDSYNGKK